MRKTKTVTITAEGEDKGKTFLITRMSAWAQEDWALRAVLAMGRAGITVPDGAMQAGMIGLMSIGFSSMLRVSFEDGRALLSELNACIAYVPDPHKTDPSTGLPMTRPLSYGDQFNDGDIVEMNTLLELRKEVAELHLGFSMTDALSKLTPSPQPSSPSDTPTSPKPAARSSKAAKQA